jgi:hypothetical protein
VLRANVTRDREDSVLRGCSLLEIGFFCWGLVVAEVVVKSGLGVEL